MTDQAFKSTEHNTFFVQITVPKLLVDESFSFDIIYQSGSSDEERQQDLTGKYFDEEILRLQQEFDHRFNNIFKLKSKPNMTEKRIDFARSTLSNLLGGISYFTGNINTIMRKRKTVYFLI